MMGIQDTLNSKLNPDWQFAPYQWNAAIMVEAVELFDHLNWKWWKKTGKEVDWDQVKMEAVDIWHFLLSTMIQNKQADVNSYVELLDSMVNSPAYAKPIDESIVGHLAQDVVGSAANDAWVEELLGDFVDLCVALRISFDDLYKLYVGKAKLNELRWANGYGKTYLKDWTVVDGTFIEDNQFLSKVLELLDVNHADFAFNVAAELAKRYKLVEEYNRGQP